MGAGIVPAVAHAQIDTPLINPAIPDSFDRGRNVSVIQRARPDYDPLGIQVSSFKVFPRLDTGIGFTDNVFVSSVSPKSDGFFDLTPSFTATSDWSRHLVQARGTAQFRRFWDTPRRRENTFNIGTLGRADIGSSFALTGEAQYARLFETPFSGEVASDVAVLSNYHRSFFAVRGQYQAGQGRVTLALDRGDYVFDRIPLAGGGSRDQSDRDRKIVRGSGQVEYAFTPSVAVYGQAQYTDTNYDKNLLSGAANRDSDAYRFIAGFSFDLAGLLRGSLGAGYTRRDFHAAIYEDVGGFSAEGKLEYFPTELTTVTLGASRILQDSAIGSASAYFDNRLSLRADHELLRNMLLNAVVEVGRQKFIGISGKTNLYRISGGAKYMVSHLIALDAGLSYAKQDTENTAIGRNYDETRGQARITFQL